MENGGILLMSLPWRLSNWPSTALGTLKAYLRAHGVATDTAHLHVDVAAELGRTRYHALAEQAWHLADVLYSCLLEPAEADALLRPAVDELRRQGMESLADWAATTAVEDVRAATEKCLATIDMSRFWVCGLSVGALQLTSSLYVARLLRERAPHLSLIVGGAGVVGEVGEKLLRVEPTIDLVVDGEGEETLLALARLGPPFTAERLRGVPNLWLREPGGGCYRTSTKVLPRLDETPLPDYSEFFAAVERLGYQGPAIVLPVEASRGCAWEHRCGDGELRGCTFCGLFRTSPDYREKALPRVLSEIRTLVEDWRHLDLGFVDAYLPSSYRRELLEALGQQDHDLSLWCELRSDLDDDIASLLAAAGLRKAQIGVEAFHTGMLMRMEKGTRAIDNVYALRLCEEYGIEGQYNLITHYPGVPAHEVEEMLDVLPALYGLRPPSVGAFYLDRGSRVYQMPARYGLRPEDIDHAPAQGLPSRLASSKVTQVVPFRVAAIGDDATAAWSRVYRAADEWREVHSRAVRAGFPNAFFYRDGGHFLEVTDCRSGKKRSFLLGAEVRDILLACRTPTTLPRLAAHLGKLRESQLVTLLGQLVQHQLIFREAQFYVTVPAWARRPNGSPSVRPLGGVSAGLLRRGEARLPIASQS